MIKTLIRCMNLRTLPVGVAGVIIGTASAVLMGNMEIIPASLCLLFVIFAQISANLYHRFSEYSMLPAEMQDYSDTDVDNLPLGRVLREAAFGFGLVAAVIGLGLNAYLKSWGLLIGVLIVVAVLLYNNRKFPLSRTPFAPVITFLFFGPVVVMCTSFVQTAHGAAHKFEWLDVGPSVYNSVIAGLMAVNVLYVHNCIHLRRDRERGRHTFVEVLGFNTARWMIMINSLIVVLACASLTQEFVVTKGWDEIFTIPYFWYNMVFSLLWFFFNLWIVSRMKEESTEGCDSLEFYAALGMLALAVAQFIFFYIVGKPDDSTTTFFGVSALL